MSFGDRTLLGGSSGRDRKADTPAVADNLIATGTIPGGTTAITLSGSANQSPNTSGGTDFPNGTLAVAKSGGTASLVCPMTLNGLAQSLTASSGTVQLAAGYGLDLTGTLSAASGAVLKLPDGETIAATAITFNSGRTAGHDGGGSQSSLAAGNRHSNLTFDNALGAWNHTGA